MASIASEPALSAITDAIRNGSGFFQHGHTFMGHATAVAAWLATLSTIESEDLLANVRERGASMLRRLREELGVPPEEETRRLYQAIRDRASDIHLEPLMEAAQTYVVPQASKKGVRLELEVEPECCAAIVCMNVQAAVAAVMVRSRLVDSRVLFMTDLTFCPERVRRSTP